MIHADAMLERLPTLYRDGELLRQVVTSVALQLAMVDEELLAIQQAHFFNTTLERSEAARLAALLAIAPEEWQQLAEFRAWVHALRDAVLKRGAVTVPALQLFVEEYTRRYQQVTRTRLVEGLGDWNDRPSSTRPALQENPLRRRYERVPQAGGLEPLQQFRLEQRGLESTPAQILLVGLPTGPESVPAIINVTTGQALVYAGNVPPGARLWITTDAAGVVSAQLERQDVSAQLFSVAGVQPGTTWTEPQVRRPAQPLRLVPGSNELWFLPLALYDALGLDRFLLALADLALTQGRFDITRFDQALFYQDPAVALFVSWLETQPATFQISLPAASLQHAPAALPATLAAREELTMALELAVARLRAAGVAGSVGLEPFRECQGQRDYLTMTLPLRQREMGAVGADRLPDVGGVYDVSTYDGSIFR